VNRGFLVALGIALATSGCGDREVEPKNIEPRPEPVVVYANYEDKSYLPTLFADFTHETGIRVTVKTATPDIIVSNVIEDRGSPPADLILTPTVIGVWRAADEGALLPLRSELVKETVPESFRDPDGYWVAVGFQTALIVLSTSDGLADGVTHYEDLAKPEFKGKLCLSSSALPENRSLIAMLIGKHGVRGAELIVRGWVQNLALPPKRSESELLQAIELGTCAIGIVSSAIVGTQEDENGTTELRVVTPQEVHVNIETVGINRHAREPEAARQLLDWFLSPEIQKKHSTATGAYPFISAAEDQSILATRYLADSNAAAVAWHADDAGKLVERAGYR
jgi:iron(III) transport system substrate-binding protein